MPIPYPKELTLPYWKTKKSRLVTALDLEKLLAELERQHKKIDQAKLSATGYRDLNTVASVKQTIQIVEQLRGDKVALHEKTLRITQEIAKKTVDRLVRARTVPKADIDLVRTIEELASKQQDAWSDPTLNGKRSFEKQLKSLESKQSPLVRKMEQALHDTTLAIKATTRFPTVLFWLAGKDPRLDCKPIGDRCIEKQCKALQQLLDEQPAFVELSKKMKPFNDDYPRKQRRVQIADPKLQSTAPDEYQKQLKLEQSAIAACLVDLSRALKDIKSELSSLV